MKRFREISVLVNGIVKVLQFLSELFIPCPTVVGIISVI